MPIPTSNFPAVILLSEIKLNCDLIMRAVDGLHSAAAHWKALSEGIDDEKTAPPIDIISMCTVCLSSSAAIAKMLELGLRNKKDTKARISKRCGELMALLDQPPLTVMRSLMVRNSWEHLDERLDEALTARTFNTISEIHVEVKQPDTATFVLRHFDPVAFHITHGRNPPVNLQALTEEAKDLSLRVEGAVKSLKTTSIDVY